MQEILSTKPNVTPAQVLWNRRLARDELLADKEGLLQRLRPRLLRLAQLRGVPFDALEDVVQETLLEAWKHLDRLQSLEGMQPWVEEICRNVCRRHARRQWTDMQHAAMLLTPSPFDEDEPSGEAEGSFLETLPDGRALDLSEELSRQDMTTLLNQALGSLPASAREVVELCYLKEMPQREAAERLGISLSALEARLHRARLHLKQILSGPLRQDAVALGLALDEAPGDGWQETRLWCSLCGRRRLLGTFAPQPDGSVNLHLECPDCTERYRASIHSMGLVPLGQLRAFRPAWKRTMQGLSDQLTRALARGWYPCARCGAQAPIQVMTATEVSHSKGCDPQAPYQFWVGWQCLRCRERVCPALSADELTYWSHPLARKFILEHPRWLSLPDRPIEYKEQAAIHFQLADVASADHLDVLADRQTLRILAVS